MNDPLTPRDIDDDELRIYESSGTIFLNDDGFEFTEDTLISAMNSLHRMLDKMICDNAKKDLHGQETTKHATKQD